MTGYINHTNCIHRYNLERIEQAIAHLFELEGASRIPLPPLSPPGIEKLSQELWGCISDAFYLAHIPHPQLSHGLPLADFP